MFGDLMEVASPPYFILDKHCDQWIFTKRISLMFLMTPRNLTHRFIKTYGVCGQDQVSL